MALRKVNRGSTSSSNSSIELSAREARHDQVPRHQKILSRTLLFLSLPHRSFRIFSALTSFAMLSLIITYLTLSLTIPISFSQSTSSSAPAPSGTAVAGTYDGILRPQVHFSPPVGFMNDPNGMFLDAQGIYHLYYQYNPTDTIAGNQHWGHATSRDLYHWTNQPIALFPYDDITGIFTGSCVIDVNNTSGFYPNQDNGEVAIYTGNSPIEQDQRLAYSLDSGYTWTEYAQNPVLAIGDPNFRDPKVIWHAPTSNWIMAIAYATEYTIGIFTSPNLIDWTHASNFTNYGLLGLQYECPNLVSIPHLSSNGTLLSEMYLMYISINPGAPLGGSVGQFFPGTFNGTHFSAVDAAARIADFGKDNYATQFFYEDGESGADVRGRTSIAWASNWEYTNSVPSGPREGWQSAMSLPRRNWLEDRGRLGWSLISVPIDLSPVIGDAIVTNDNFGNGSESISITDATGSIMLQLNITSLNTSQITATTSCNFTMSSSQTHERIRGGQFFSSSTFHLDRGESGWGTGILSASGSGYNENNPYFADKVSVALESTETYELLVVLDRSVVEVFLNGGVRSATQTFFPNAIMDSLDVSCGGLNADAQVSVGAWTLNSAWQGTENGDGVVTGNGTQVRRA